MKRLAQLPQSGGGNFRMAVVGCWILIHDSGSSIGRLTRCRSRSSSLTLPFALTITYSISKAKVGAGGGWGWRRWGGGFGDGFGTSTTTEETYKVGTLVVDLFDTNTKKLIWRGSASDTLRQI